MVTSGGIYTEINTLKTSVSNGKSAIASAITDKGISTSSSDTFNTMATNIRNISFDFSGANVTVDDLPAGVYAWDASGTLIGREIIPGEYGSDVISGTLTKGSFVRFDGIDWIVANVSGNTYTLMLKKMTETTTFGSSINYSGSTIASKCSTFQNAMSANALSVVNSKTVRWATAKVWIAQTTDIMSWTESYQPASYDWSGIRKWTNGEGIYDGVGTNYYWCSDTNSTSDYDYVLRVDRNGYFGNNLPAGTLGFRPCIEVTQ